MVLGLDRKLVASTGLIALWRGLFDNPIHRVLAGLSGIIIEYYEKRLAHV
jgi:hypothetical protein